MLGSWWSSYEDGEDNDDGADNDDDDYLKFWAHDSGKNANFDDEDFSIDDDRYIREGNEKHIFRVILDRIPFKMDYLFEYLFKVNNKLSFKSLT